MSAFNAGRNERWKARCEGIEKGMKILLDMKLEIEVEKYERRWERCLADEDVVGPGLQAATFTT
jgi:hypothetical protein